MAAIHIPRRHLIQPQGRLQVDWGSPLCDRLALCTSYGGDRAQPIVGPAATTNTIGDNAVSRAGVGSKIVSEGHEFNFGPASTEWTLLSLAALGTAKSALLSQANNPTQSQTYLLANTGSGFAPEAGSFCFGSGINAGDATLLKATSAIDADPRAYLGLHRADGAEEIWWDGTNRGSRSKTVTLNQADARIRIEGIYTYSGWYSGSNLHILDLVWAVGLRPELAQAVTENPWQIFRRDPIRFYSLPAAGQTSGTLSALETGSDAFASSGAVIVAGTLSAQETGSDTLSASGAVTVSGTFTAVETGSDTFSAIGVQQVSGTLAASETGGDAFTSSGAILVSGNLAAAETGSDTLFAVGGNFASGTLSAQETGDDVFAASGAIAVAGTLTAAETGADTLAASGAVKISGTAAASEAGSDLAAFSGQIIVSGGFAAAESGGDTFQAGSGGYTITFAQAQLLSQIYLLHGLGSPLSVAPTSRAVAGLSQEITSLSGTVTVKTLAQEPALAAPVGTMLEELAALHGLTVDLVVTPTSRTAGGISQAFTTVGSQTTITRQ